MFVFADTLSLQCLIDQKQFGLFSSNIWYYIKVDYLRDGYILVGPTELFQVLNCRAWWISIRPPPRFC